MEIDFCTSISIDWIFCLGSLKNLFAESHLLLLKYHHHPVLRSQSDQRIQFHLRDAKTSALDLEILVDKYQRQTPKPSGTVGALMFSCLGRGVGLYGQANFDSSLFGRYIANVPISGFFCSGEIGPVAGSTFLHGYTSVFGICREPWEIGPIAGSNFLYG